MLQQEKPDCFALTEHWKDPDELEQHTFADYKLVSAFCRSKGKHGGCAVYCLNHMEIKERLDLKNLSVSTIIECSACNVSVYGSKKIVVVCIYRPSSSHDFETFFEKLTLILEILNSENATYVITGDFNINLLDRELEVAHDLVSLLETFDVEITVWEPTRISSGRCLDNVFTNIGQGKTTVIEAHLSDHSAQLFRSNIEVVKKQSHKTVSYRNYNAEALNAFLESLKGKTCGPIGNVAAQGVNETWNEFSDFFITTFNDHFPLLTKKVPINSKRYKESPELFKLKQHLDSLFVISCINTDFVEMYKRAKRDYDIAICRDKRNYYGNLIENSANRPKTTWQIINDLKPSKKRPKTSILPDGNLQEIAEKFNILFQSNEAGYINLVQENSFSGIKKIENSFYVFPVTEGEVLSCIKSLKNKNSTGYDGIPMRIIKDSAHIIAEPLSRIINKSFIEGVFPDRLKMAIIKPLLKKGDAEHLGNYRPISILNSFSKIFEKILAQRLIKFFGKFHAFDKSQHGFLSGRSTETAIFQFITSIINSIEAGEVPLCLFLDLSKAFDNVDHSILIHKLERYGIRDKQLHLILNYLQNRTQQVAICMDGREYNSTVKKIARGVPQGSILGPLLFVLYINDLPEVLREHSWESVLYADDTNIMIRSHKISNLIYGAQNALTQTKKWCEQNSLQLNMTKTECVAFRTDRNNLLFPNSFECRGQTVMLENTTRFLGIHLDENLKWKEHSRILIKKLNSSIYSLRVLKFQIDANILRIIYCSQIESLLTYGIIFWGGSSLIDRIFIAQKQALRVLLGLGFRESCRGHFKEAGLMTLPGMYVYKCICFILDHPKFFEEFKNQNNTRRLYPYHYPLHSLTLSQKGVHFMCIKLLNSLPSDMLKSRKLERFKRILKRFIINSEPYNLAEFYTWCRNYQPEL